VLVKFDCCPGLGIALEPVSLTVLQGLAGHEDSLIHLDEKFGFGENSIWGSIKKYLGNLIHSGMEITDGSTSSPIILGKSNPSAPDTMPL